MSLERIYGIFLENIYRLRHSWEEIVDTFYWPIMDVILWGFLTIFISKQQGLGSLIISFLLGGIILWTIAWRTQQDISVSLLNDAWSHNLLNIFGSPLTPWEFLVATVFLGLIKITMTTIIMGVMAYFFYTFSLLSLGFYLLPFIALLLLFGWSMGIFITGLIIYFGRKIQNLAWSFILLFQPISCVSYPLSSLPEWLRPFASLLPTTYVFEGMRKVMSGGSVSFLYLLTAAGINLLFLTASLISFSIFFNLAKRDGRLVRMQE